MSRTKMLLVVPLAAFVIAIAGGVAFDSGTANAAPPNCRGKIASALAGEYGGLKNAATGLGFDSVQDLQDEIKTQCD